MSIEKVMSQDAEKEEQGVQAHAEQEVDIQKLEQRVVEIREEITLLKRKLKEAEAQRNKERAELARLWKEKIIKSGDEYEKLLKDSSGSAELINEQIYRKRTEYRVARAEYLSQAVPPDALRQRVLDLRISEDPDQFAGKDIQEGGINTLGVYEIEGGEFVLIKKPKSVFRSEDALPYLMQDVGTDRIPRVLEIFHTDDATYKVMERASGVQLDKLTAEQVAEIPQEHIDQLVADLFKMEGMGLEADASKKSNFFYDKEKGFSIIDILDAYYVPDEEENPINVDEIRLRAILLTGKEQDKEIEKKMKKAIERVVAGRETTG